LDVYFGYLENRLQYLYEGANQNLDNLILYYNLGISYSSDFV